jgi:23S rRNA pseudouridine2605 synthase
MRLAKFLANSGVASRRAAEEIIRAGRVTIDGETVCDPARDVPDVDPPQVTVDRRPVAPPRQTVVYAVNKPPGVVSTARDPQRRPTVVSLVPSPTRLYPVGRLDIDTTGLILLTDDGDLAHRLTHPRYEVPRTYRALLAEAPTPAALRRLRGGVALEDGLTAPATVRRIGGVGSRAIELTIHEGRKRQVKRMCEAVGHPVVSLQRVAVGGLVLGDLPPGSHRRLSEGEVQALKASASGGAARRGAASSYVARQTPPGGSGVSGGRPRGAGS